MTRSAPRRGQGQVLILMAIVLIWSLALAGGFGWIAATGPEHVGMGRRLAFGAVSLFLAIIAVRTSYELYLRVRPRSQK